MKKLIKWCNWELNNEFIACGYFAVMLSMYCIIELIFGEKDVNIFILLEMFLVNYLLATLQKLILDMDKDYSKKSFILRATLLSLTSIAVVVLVSRLGGWFNGMPLWAGPLVYAMLVLAFLTVWIIIDLGKKQDTKQLNEQLNNFKNKGKND